MNARSVDVMTNYVAAFSAANTMSEPPHIYYAAGWYTIKPAGSSPARRYRRVNIEEMTLRLRERAALSIPSNRCLPMTCGCDFATGECQAPSGCVAVAEVERLRSALREIISKGNTTGYGRTALASIAREAIDHTPGAYAK